MQNSINKKETLTYGTYLDKEASKNILRLVFNDQGRPNIELATIELLADGTMKWSLKNPNGLGVIVKGKKLGESDRNFYVPTDLILTKVK